MYNPGRNKTRIKAYSQGADYTENEVGELVPVLKLKFVDWAEIKRQSGKEVLEQRKTEHQLGRTLSMRFRPDLAPEDLIYIGEDEYLVLAILPMGRYMEVVVEWQK